MFFLTCGRIWGRGGHGSKRGAVRVVKGERKRKKMRKVTVGVSMIKVQYMQA
jgi:hypothetical protein